jgi:hypothetical protein
MSTIYVLTMHFSLSLFFPLRRTRTIEKVNGFQQPGVLLRCVDWYIVTDVSVERRATACNVKLPIFCCTATLLWLFYSKDEGTALLLNASNYLLVDVKLHPRRLVSPSTPSRFSQGSQVPKYSALLSSRNSIFTSVIVIYFPPRYDFIQFEISHNFDVFCRVLSYFIFSSCRCHGTHRIGESRYNKINP